MAELVLSKLGEAVHKQPNSLHVFICTKLMIPVWVSLLLKMTDLVIYGPLGRGDLAILNARVVCSYFYFPPHPTQVLEA